MPGCEPANPVESTSAPDGQYHGLVLDFGGVLTTSFDGALHSYCVRDGLDPDALEKIFNLDQGAQGALADLERGRISQAQFVAHIAAALGVDPDGLLERMLADLRWEPLVVAAVAQLRPRGIKVAVLSNGGGSTPFDPYSRFQLGDRYDVVVISDQVRLRKPDPEIFALTLERLELPGELCVFVDDVARYLPAARALGIATIHATDPATTVAELERLFGSHPLHPATCRAARVPTPLPSGCCDPTPTTPRDRSCVVGADEPGATARVRAGRWLRSQTRLGTCSIPRG